MVSEHCFSRAALVKVFRGARWPDTRDRSDPGRYRWRTSTASNTLATLTRGITRLRKGPRFACVDADNRAIADAAVLARIVGLAIPPAYENV
jgi:DNA topoisomerase IB